MLQCDVKHFQLHLQTELLAIIFAPLNFYHISRFLKYFRVHVIFNFIQCHSQRVGQSILSAIFVLCDCYFLSRPEQLLRPIQMVPDVLSLGI
jgi:hypothetical protein